MRRRERNQEQTKPYISIGLFLFQRILQIKKAISIILNNATGEYTSIADVLLSSAFSIPLLIPLL